MLPLPVEFSSAPNPKALLLFPVVLDNSAEVPKPVFAVPVEFAFSDSSRRRILRGVFR